MTNREMKQLLRQTNMSEDDAKKAIEILRQTNMTEHKYKELSQEEFISWLVRYGCNAERLLKASGDMIAD